MWQALPFDDLQHYIKLGYHVKTEWLLVAALTGLAIGAYIVASSREAAESFYASILVGFVLGFALALVGNETEQTKHTSWVSYESYQQAGIDQALMWSCWWVFCLTLLVMSLVHLVVESLSE